MDYPMFKSGIGIDNFRKFIELKRTYVDKTQFIESFINSDYPEVALFTRPRRLVKL